MGNPHGLDIEENKGKHGKAQKKEKEGIRNTIGEGWVGGIRIWTH